MSEWQPVVGWEQLYEVSAKGAVRRIGRGLLCPWPNDQGYLLVRLTDLKTERRGLFRVHRLVAEAFIPNPDNLPVINHKDSVRFNNAVENLEWCTQQDNLAHATKLGRMQRDYWAGKRSPNAALSDEQVRSIRQRYTTGEWSYERLADEYDISKRSIGRIIKRDIYADVA